MSDLTFSGLKTMNTAEYKKQFKKAAVWRKAKGVLFFAKHKLNDGKKSPLIAIPFKKYNEAAKCFKNEVKKDKDIPYKSKLTMLAHDNDLQIHFQLMTNKLYN